MLTLERLGPAGGWGKVDERVNVGTEILAFVRVLDFELMVSLARLSQSAV